MSFPTISFKHTNTYTDYKLQEVITQKFTSLEKYLGDETDVRCDVELEKVTPQKNGDVYRMEANVWFAGTLFRAEATLDSYEKALDEVRAELDKEMRRANNRRTSLFRKGARKIKSMMQWSR